MTRSKVVNIIIVIAIIAASLSAGILLVNEIKKRDDKKREWSDWKYKQRCEEMQRLEIGEIIVSDSKLWMVTGKYNNEGKAKILNPDGSPDETQFTAMQLKVASIVNGKATLYIDKDSTMTANFLEAHNER